MPEKMPKPSSETPQEGEQKITLKDRLESIEKYLPQLCADFGIPEETGTEIFNFIYDTADISQGILEGDSLKDVLYKISFFINKNTKKIDNAQRQEFKNQLQNLILDEGVVETNKEEKDDGKPKPEAEDAGKKVIKPVDTKKPTGKEESKEKVDKGEIYSWLKSIKDEILEFRRNGYLKKKKWKDYLYDINECFKKLESDDLNESLLEDVKRLIARINNDLSLEAQKVKEIEEKEQKKEEKVKEHEARINKYSLLKARLEKDLTLVSYKTALNDLLDRLNKLDPNNLKGEDQISDFNKEVKDIEEKLKILAKDLKIEDVYQEMREFAEKLGYVYIDPKIVMEKLSKDDLEAFQTLITKEQKGEVTEQDVLDFLKAKVGQIVIDTGKEKLLEQKKIDEVAKNIFDSIKNSIDAKARYNLEKLTFKNFGKKALKALPRILLFSAPVLLITGVPILGLGALTAGLLGGSALIGGLGLSIGTTLYSMGLRKKLETKDAANAQARQEKFERDLDKEQEKALAEFFRNLDDVQKQLGAIISTEIRTATNPEARQLLEECQAAEIKGTPIVEAKLQKVEKELFRSALTKVRAEYPDISKEQQEHLAVLIAQTLSAHVRGDNAARQEIGKLKQEKPEIIKYIEKFNIFRTGRDTRKKDDKEKMNLFQKHKYDGLALTLGISISIGAKHIPILRNVLGAATGAYLGYGLAETLTRGQEQKAMISIGKMIDEAEKKIQDIEFPAAELPELRENAKVVESRLELGILDSDPWLKTRAENFIFNVRQAEMANEKVLMDLLNQQKENNDGLGEQIDKDYKKIGKKNRFIKKASVIGGILAGGLTPTLLTESAQAFSGHHQVNMEDIYNSQPGATHEQINEAINNLHLNDQRLTPEDYFAIISGKQRGDSLSSNLYDHFNKAKGTWEITNEQITGDANRPIILRDENGDGLPEIKGIDGKWHQVNDLEDLKKQIGYDAKLADQQKGGVAGATTEDAKDGAGQTTAPEKSQALENTINSSELGDDRHDSVWFSTFQLFKEHANDLGFPGEPVQLDDWAEHQTNIHLEELKADMGGKITDLVHDGDKVILEPTADGKWHLKLVEDSGIKASYLPEKDLPKVDGGQKILADEVRVEPGQPTELERLLTEKTHLETQLQEDINRLKELHEHGLITEEQLEKDILNAQGKYRQPISGLEMAIKDIEQQTTAGGAQIEANLPGGINDLLTAHQGKTDAINFINSHKEMYPVTLHEVLSGGDILEKNLGANIGYERILELHKAGYHVSAVTAANEMFPKETTVIFTRENHPAIYLNKDSECGYLVGEKLMKSEHVLKLEEINSQNLEGMESEAQRINMENQLATMIDKSGHTEQVINSGLLKGVMINISPGARDFIDKHGFSLDIYSGQFRGLKEGVVDFTSAPDTLNADITKSISMSINGDVLEITVVDQDGSYESMLISANRQIINPEAGGFEVINRGSNSEMVIWETGNGFHYKTPDSRWSEQGYNTIEEAEAARKAAIASDSATQGGQNKVEAQHTVQSGKEFTDIANDFQGRFREIKMNFQRPELLGIQDKELFDAEEFKKTLTNLKDREAVIDEQLEVFSNDQNITAEEQAELERLLTMYHEVKIQSEDVLTAFDKNLNDYLQQRAGLLKGQRIADISIGESDVSRGLVVKYLDANGQEQAMQFEDPAAQADPKGYIEESIKKALERGQQQITSELLNVASPEDLQIGGGALAAAYGEAKPITINEIMSFKDKDALLKLEKTADGILAGLKEKTNLTPEEASAQRGITGLLETIQKHSQELQN